jgi:hypothetical protein
LRAIFSLFADREISSYTIDLHNVIDGRPGRIEKFSLQAPWQQGDLKDFVAARATNNAFAAGVILFCLTSARSRDPFNNTRRFWSLRCSRKPAAAKAADG